MIRINAMIRLMKCTVLWGSASPCLICRRGRTEDQVDFLAEAMQLNKECNLGRNFCTIWGKEWMSLFWRMPATLRHSKRDNTEYWCMEMSLLWFKKPCGTTKVDGHKGFISGGAQERLTSDAWYIDVRILTYYSSRVVENVPVLIKYYSNERL